MQLTIGETMKYNPSTEPKRFLNPVSKTYQFFFHANNCNYWSVHDNLSRFWSHPTDDSGRPIESDEYPKLVHVSTLGESELQALEQAKKAPIAIPNTKIVVQAKVIGFKTPLFYLEFSEEYTRFPIWIGAMFEGYAYRLSSQMKVECNVSNLLDICDSEPHHPTWREPSGVPTRFFGRVVNRSLFNQNNAVSLQLTACVWNNGVFSSPVSLRSVFLPLSRVSLRSVSYPLPGTK
jgi:hypothetical protein